MKYAVIQTGGKQYRVSEGDIIEVERLSGAKDETISFTDVLLYTADGTVNLGTPLIEGATVTGKIVDHLKGEKIRVSKYKAKVRYRRVTGHRQSLTKVQIEQIAFKQSKATQTAASEK